MDENRILGATHPHMCKHPKNPDLRSRFEANLTFDLSYALGFGLISKTKKGGMDERALIREGAAQPATVCDHKLLKTEGSSPDLSSTGTAEIPHVAQAQ